MKFFTHLVICSLFCGMLFGMEKPIIRVRIFDEEAEFADGEQVSLDESLKQRSADIEKINSALREIEAYQSQGVEKFVKRIGEVFEEINALFKRMLSDPFVQEDRGLLIKLLQDHLRISKVLRDLYNFGCRLSLASLKSGL